MASAPVSDLLPSGERVPPPAQPRADLGTRDQFLKLLVTQLQHQNPLEPLDPTDFAAQLSQFSSVERLLNIEELMKAEAGSQSALQGILNTNLAASLLGKEVLGQGDQFLHEAGESSALRFELDRPAANVQVTILNSGNLAVDTVSLPSAVNKGVHEVVWDGLGAAGGEFSAGLYRFVVKAVDANGAAVPAVPYVRGRIDGVQIVAGQPRLTINGAQVALSDVHEILEPTP